MLYRTFLKFFLLRAVVHVLGPPIIVCFMVGVAHLLAMVITPENLVWILRLLSQLSIHVLLDDKLISVRQDLAVGVVARLFVASRGLSSENVFLCRLGRVGENLFTTAVCCPSEEEHDSTPASLGALLMVASKLVPLGCRTVDSTRFLALFPDDWS